VTVRILVAVDLLCDHHNTLSIGGIKGLEFWKGRLDFSVPKPEAIWYPSRKNMESMECLMIPLEING